MPGCVQLLSVAVISRAESDVCADVQRPKINGNPDSLGLLLYLYERTRYFGCEFSFVYVNWFYS